jgi:YQGE family putative transporter
MMYQLAIYTSIPITFFINGFTEYGQHQKLFSLGMLLSGVSMVYMMSLDRISYSGLISGLIMECPSAYIGPIGIILYWRRHPINKRNF